MLIIPARPFPEFSKIIICAKFHEYVFEALKSFLSPKNSRGPLRIQVPALPTNSRVLGQVILKPHALVRYNSVTFADTFPTEVLGDDFASAAATCAALCPEGAWSSRRIKMIGINIIISLPFMKIHSLSGLSRVAVRSMSKEKRTEGETLTDSLSFGS
ncbi:hypothetical protein HJG60_010547 [Phyllostomus discolor]|uniref:Uncharacterized protein n=1 Tax=Phyllostomus discolor TaxID=89673 RepID=A0A834AHK6_9CHIR|nr:hypothetical protein HJG60_010547 [Phyllostomus discolor]